MKKKVLTICLAVVCILVLVSIFSKSDNSTGDSKKTTAKEPAADESAAAEKPAEETVEYVAYDVGTMMSDLESNAMNAEETYSDQYVEITGKLNSMDSDGKYISLTPGEDEYAIIGVQCYIKNDEQKDKVMTMTIGDTVTLKGKITSVGEVLGYSLDIDSIN